MKHFTLLPILLLCLLFFISSCDTTPKDDSIPMEDLEEADPYLTEDAAIKLAAKVFTSIDSEKLVADIVKATESEDLKSNGTGKNENGMVFTINKFSDVKSTLSKAKIDQLLNNIEDYPKDYTISIELAFPKGYTASFLDGSGLSIKGNLTFDINGKITAVGDVFFNSDDYTVSTSGIFTLNDGTFDYDVVVSNITGPISLKVDPKLSGDVILTFTNISIAEDTQGTISIEGYDGGAITYSQILDYLKETEAPVEPEV